MEGDQWLEHIHHYATDTTAILEQVVKDLERHHFYDDPTDWVLILEKMLPVREYHVPVMASLAVDPAAKVDTWVGDICTEALFKHAFQDAAAYAMNKGWTLDKTTGDVLGKSSYSMSIRPVVLDDIHIFGSPWIEPWEGSFLPDSYNTASYS